MKICKHNVIQFFKWMRNGIAFVYTWFILLLLIKNCMLKVENVSTIELSKLLVMTVGGVFLFCLFFSKLILKKTSFLFRLTCFMISITVYEIGCFYWLGVFNGLGSVKQWIILGGIILILYFICIGIFYLTNVQKEDMYTKSLISYQQRRNHINGK